MSKPQSGRSASVSRRLRRSLTEITMPMTSGAVLEKPQPAQPIPTVKPLAIFPEHAAKASDITTKGLRQSEPLNGLRLDAVNVLRVHEDVTSAAAKAAKDYRSSMFENMKNNINAALGYASGLTTLSLSSRLDAFSVSRERDPHVDPSISKPEKHVSASDNVTAEFCAKAFELMAANVTATLEYAKRLSEVKSPSEFVELSASHARKQVELTVAHTAALRTFSLVASETSEAKKRTR
jgi:Phasin protein